MKLCILLLLSSGPLYAAPTILVFGDSLSAAYGIPIEAGWASLLKQRLPKYRVINASVSGETTAGGLTRLPQVLAAHHPIITLLELGANDGLRGLPLSQARRNLEAMTDLAQAANSRVLLIGMHLPPNYGPAYTARFQAIFSEVAKSRKVHLLPFLLAGMAQHRERFQADGLHPDERSQALLLDNVWQALQPMIEEK